MTTESNAKGQPEHISQFFTHEHLPPHLAAASKPFCDLHDHIIANIPRNQQRTIALNKLMEAKDCVVRAVLAKS